MSNLHNAIKYAPQLLSGIETAVGMSQDAEGVGRVSETLTPSIDPWSQPEWAFLRGEILGTFINTQAAVAAELSFLGLGLPLNSNSILVIERCGVLGAAMNVTAGHVIRSVVAGTGAATFFTRNRDQRYAFPTAGNPIAVDRNPPVEAWAGTDPGAINGGSFELLTAVVGAVTEFLNLPVIVKPGGAYIVQGTTVNTLLTANFRYRLRTAYSGELSAQ